VRELRPRGKVVEVAGIERVQRFVERLQEAGLGERLPVGVGRYRKPVGNTDAQGAQILIHLAERGILAAHNRHVGVRNGAERANEGSFEEPVFVGELPHGTCHFATLR
jgi:hypothetical protein